MNNITTQMQTKYVEMQLSITAQFEKISKKLGMTAKQDALTSQAKITNAIADNDTETAIAEIATYTPGKIKQNSIERDWYGTAIKNKNNDICNAMTNADYGTKMDAKMLPELAFEMANAKMTDALMSLDDKNKVLSLTFSYLDTASGKLKECLARTDDTAMLTAVMQSDSTSDRFKDNLLSRSCYADKKENMQICLDNGAHFQDRSLYRALIKQDRVDMAVLVTEHVLNDNDRRSPMDAIEFAEKMGRTNLALALRKAVHKDTKPVKTWSKLSDDTAVLKQHDAASDTTLTQIFNTKDQTVITSVNDTRQDNDVKSCIKEDLADIKPAGQTTYKQAVDFLKK